MNFLFTAIVIVCIYTSLVEGSCSPKLESQLFDDLLKMMHKLKGSDHESGRIDQKAEIPAFGASTGIHRDLGENEIVKFEKVWTNIGNGYDPNSGVFTAPQAGVYQFSCSAMTDTGKTLRLHLYKNDVLTVSLYPGQVGPNMGTLNMILELKKGDRVFIKHPNGGENSLYSQSESNFSMFSGFMIS